MTKAIERKRYLELANERSRGHRLSVVGRFVILALLGWFLSLTLALGPAFTATPAKGAQLTQLGWQQFDQGNESAAYKTWKAATEEYRQDRDPVRVSGSLINQSLATQSQGLYSQSCLLVLEALQLPETICPIPGSSQADLPKRPLTEIAKADPSIKVMGLRVFGDVLRKLGDLRASKTVLEQTLGLIGVSDQNTNGLLSLSLAKTNYELFRQEQVRYDVAKSEETKTLESAAMGAINHYQQAGRSPSAKLPSALGLLELSFRFNRWMGNQNIAGSDLKTLQQKLEAIQPQLRKTIESTDFEALPDIQAIKSRLEYAELLVNFLPREKSVSERFAKLALQQAQKLNHSRSESRALGLLARLEGDPGMSEALALKAVSAARSAKASELEYHWQSFLAERYQQEKQYPKALSAYQEAVSALNRVRSDLAGVNLEGQFSFKEEIQPFYTSYLKMLLDQSNPDLDAVIETNRTSQLIELENYLRCGKLVASTDTDKDPSAANIYVINLGTRYEIVVKAKGRKIHYGADGQKLETAASNLLRVVQSDRFRDSKESEFLPDAQELYTLILKPAQSKGVLPTSGTLSFVLDRSLQNIPMSLLHDGQDYLVRRYSLALLPEGQVRQTVSSSQSQSGVLIAGVSQSSPSMKKKGLLALPEVEDEVKQVQKISSRSNLLLNQNFTRQKINELLQKPHQILHISTHGKFSSIPEETRLYAWDEIITLPGLRQFLTGQLGVGRANIDLLVLSACETAQGDPRSVLGLTGVAIQAGVRTTISSLWLVDSKSTTELMSDFYQALRDGKLKAEALRIAQLKLLDGSSTYRHPYFWSSFILAGDWR